MRFSGYAKPYKISGDYGERDPPVPMPNTEVKPFSADGTWLETTWESRTLPDSMKKNPPLLGVGSFSFHLQRSSPKSSLTERGTYLVRISTPAPCGRNRGTISPGRVRSATPFFQIAPTNVQHCTWLGFCLPPAVRDSGRQNHLRE